ncbi:MAG: glycosyl hydrolase [Gemmatimonadetes bacterium]|nr:glycosyl hydrolase [Gemmatimonadota bacterium]
MTFLLPFLTAASLLSRTAPSPTPGVAPATGLDSAFRQVKWRSIGPFRGGRSVAGTGVVGDPKTYYMGTTGGGVWKTENMGITWRNISDGYFKTGSVGAIAVAESDPNVVYVGMGEHAIRGVMTSSGDGVYRSTDAGRTWKKIGLDSTRHISRIVVDPRNPDVVFVAAQGALYGPSKQRGVYKSTDGGATWKNTLYVDEKTGAAELSMDAKNPRNLYAAMWEHGRLPWQVISGGPGSGLYRSTDGGETWEKMTKGLPDKMGKMAIAVSRSNPDKVYALIESDSYGTARGLYVSADAGRSWSQVTNEPRLLQRAWYYIELFIDPKNENRVYVLSAPALRSNDGGKTWEDVPVQHGDTHNMWINPDNPDNFILSDDGGAAITFDLGKSWSTLRNQPTGQFYRINVDNQFPYRVYAAQQDNSSVVIASRELGSGGVTENSWTGSAGGESAFLAFDPDNPRYVLGGSYAGTIDVLDTKARAGTSIMAAPIQYQSMDAKDMKYRYAWNAPIIWSPPATFYHGAQTLLKTTDLGKTWKEISPDLTRNEKAKQGTAGVPYTNEGVGAENYGTLAYVVESPRERGVIWTGSDDGLVHLTRDGGATWKNVTPKGLAECLINAIELSPFDKATAYLATTRYKFNDHTPGLYKTTDYGETWTRIDAGIPRMAFTRVVREDDGRRDLLFAGTELGLFISWNGGKDWSPFQLNLPVTPITDLRIHRGNLIASTSGRGLWILDDLALIRQYREDAPDYTIYRPADAYLVNGGSELDRTTAEFTGADPTRGVNPAGGIVLYYQLPKLEKTDSVILEVTDSAGTLVRRVSSKQDSTSKASDGDLPTDPVLPAAPGINRFVWDLRYPTMPAVPGTHLEASYQGHKASPGLYRFALKLGIRTAATEAAILPNPLYPTDAATYAEYHGFMRDMERELTLMHQTVNRLHAVWERLAVVLAALPAGDQAAAGKRDGEALLAKLKAWDEDMIQRRAKVYDDVENFPQKFTAHYIFLINQTESDLPRVNQPSRDRREELDRQWAALKARSDAMTNEDIPALNRKLWEAGIGAIGKP